MFYWYTDKNKTENRKSNILKRNLKKYNSEQTEQWRDRTVKKQNCDEPEHNISLANIIIVNCILS